ncbi:MAG: hypothetical protein ABWY08_16735 [Comamonas sp.]
MDAPENARMLEKLRQYAEELEKLREEERSLMEKNGLDGQSLQALLEIPLSDEDAAKVQAGVQEKLQQIERDIEWRIKGGADDPRPKNSVRRHHSKI